MSPTVTPPVAAPPQHPVRTALADPMLRIELTRHAQAVFAMKLASRPAALRAEETEDAVQETLKRALSIQATFNPTTGSTVDAWMHGIMNKVCFEHCRK